MVAKRRFRPAPRPRPSVRSICMSRPCQDPSQEVRVRPSAAMQQSKSSQSPRSRRSWILYSPRPAADQFNISTSIADDRGACWSYLSRAGCRLTRQIMLHRHPCKNVKNFYVKKGSMEKKKGSSGCEIARCAHLGTNSRNVLLFENVKKGYSLGKVHRN